MSTDRTVDPVTKVAPAEAVEWPLVLDGELMRAGEAIRVVLELDGGA
jgi:hypothetical protein